MNSERSEEFPQGRLIRPEDVKRKGARAAVPRGRMREAAKMLEFELAAALRDQIIELRGS